MQEPSSIATPSIEGRSGYDFGPTPVPPPLLCRISIASPSTKLVSAEKASRADTTAGIAMAGGLDEHTEIETATLPVAAVRTPALYGKFSSKHPFSTHVQEPLKSMEQFRKESRVV
jgi:hypothetical protein